jgi:hypothetical protein
MLNRICVLAAAAAAALLAAGTASAQCGRVVVTQPAYHAPLQYSTTFVPTKKIVVEQVVDTVAFPVAVPVLVPSFQYQYQPACQPVAAPFVQQPGTVQQPAYGPGVPVQQQPGAAPPLTEDQKMRLLAQYLVAELRRQSEVGSPDDAGPPTAIDPYGSGPGVGNYPARPQQPGTSQQPTLDVRAQAVAILSNRCASCHTGAESRSRSAVLFSSPGQFNPGMDTARLVRAVRNDRMPLDGPPLPPNEKAVIEAAFGQGVN